MLKNKVIGHLTVRIPVRLVEDQESWEIPQIYTYLEADPAELVSHDIPMAFHERMRETLEESGGFQVGSWGEAELAETTTLHEHPLPAAEPLPAFDLFSFTKTAE
jgi:hypothetical protein